MTEVVDVVAAVISPPECHVQATAALSPNEPIVLSQRRPGQHLAGQWEFPGGRIEPGESDHHALVRELQEELGIEVRATHPVAAVTHRYPEKTVRLRLHRVLAWSGRPSGREGQAWAWVPWAEVPALPLPAADHAMVKLLSHPPTYLMAPKAHESTASESRLASWIGHIERLKAWASSHSRPIVCWRVSRSGEVSSLEAIDRQAVERARQLGCVCLVEGSIEQALALSADGIQLSAQLGRSRTQRPSAFDWVAMQCTNHADMQQAATLGLDFVVWTPDQDHSNEAGGLLESGLPWMVPGPPSSTSLEAIKATGAFGLVVDSWHEGSLHK